MPPEKRWIWAIFVLSPKVRHQRQVVVRAGAGQPQVQERDAAVVVAVAEAGPELPCRTAWIRTTKRLWRH